MTIIRDLQKLDLGTRIELFELDATVLGGAVTYFHAGTTLGRAAVVWQGNTYGPWPIDASGFEFNGRGQLPTPTVRVANIGGIMTALNNAYDDLVGAKLTRRRTLAKYLDGAPGADPTAHLPDDVYYIDRKTSSSRTMVEYACASLLDVEGVYIPLRQVIANSCGWEYRGEGCGFTGGATADINDVPTAILNNDRCSHKLTGCRLRFGEHGPLPIGAFPGASRV